MAIQPVVQPDSDNINALPLNFRSFESQVLYFNVMYKLPAPPLPTVHAVITDERRKLLIAAADPLEEHDIKHASGPTLLAYRLKSFKATILREVEEVEDIIIKLAEISDDSTVVPSKYQVEDILTELADWLGDIQVYCASEMAKFGLPVKDILTLIMQSNFSKLQLDGSVKYDEHGKVEKGPMYWKPEPSIKQLLIELAKG